MSKVRMQRTKTSLQGPAKLETADKSKNKVLRKRVLKNKKLLIYMPSYMGMIDSHTVESLNEISFDAARIKGLETYLQIGKRMHTTNARNLAVETAIKGNADYILWIDDDMWIPPNTHILEKLLDHDKDIVAPLFFVRRPPYMPLLFKRKVMADGMYTTFNNIMDYEPGLHQVDGIGFGVVLTKVDVFRRLEPPYFVMSDTFGEDLFFCYDKETQVVTKAGIKYIKDVTIEDELLTLNKDNISEYHKPIRTFKKYEEKLLHFKSRRIDLMVSKDQNLLVGYEYKQKGICKPLTPVRAEDINDKLWHRQCRHYVKKNGGKWYGDNDCHGIKIGDKLYETEKFVRLLAWYLSEGCIEKREHNSNTIMIYQSLKNEENRKEIIELIESCGLKPRALKARIDFSDRDLREYFGQFGKSHEKYVPEDIKSLQSPFLDLFLKTFVKGDGHRKEKADIDCFFTSSKKLRDDIIELLLKTGKTFSFSGTGERVAKFKNGSYLCKNVWQIVSCNKTKERAYLRKAKEVEYNDYVYDVEVPNHTIYVIRNGKGLWSCNCNRAINANFKIYCDTTIKVGHIGDPPIIQEGNYLDNRQGADFWLAQKKDKDLKKVFNLTKKADIIMPCYHEFEKTKTAIESILTFTKDIDYRLIIINDGNDKEIKKYVNTISKHRKNIVYIANKENVGWVKAINQGIAFSEAPYVVFLNNDIEILPNMKHWLLRLVSGCMPEGIGATGPTSNFVMGIQNITYTEKVNVAEHFARFLIGFCMCVKREAIEKVGVLDEIFGIGGNDDLDYSIRLKKAGYKLKVLRDVFIQHEGNVSLNKAFGGPKGTVKEDKRTRKILVKKWGKAEVDRLFWFEEIKQATKFLMTGID